MADELEERIPATLRESLLEADTVAGFLRLLHGEARLEDVASRLKPHGGPSTGQAVGDYVRRGRLAPHVQRAYAAAYGFRSDDRLRVHLLDLVAGTKASRRRARVIP